MSLTWMDAGHYNALPTPTFDDLLPSGGFAVIDLETTGFNPPDDKIVEIGIVLMDETYQPTHKIETLVNPQRTMKASHIHKITGKDVIHAPTFQDISLSLFALLNGRVVVAHNKNFEKKFLVSEFKESNFFKLAFMQDENFLDTMVVAPQIFPGIGKTLAALTKASNIEITNPHAAYPDAEGTAKLLELCGPLDTICKIPEKIQEARGKVYETKWQRRSINYGLSLWFGRE